MCIRDWKGNELERIRKSTPKNYNGTLDIVCELVNYLEDKYKYKCSVGVGSPGALSFENDCIKGGNSTWLNNRPLKKDLELRLNRNIFLENDANYQNTALGLGFDNNQSNFNINQEKLVKTNQLDAKLDYWNILNIKSDINFTVGTILSDQKFDWLWYNQKYLK